MIIWLGRSANALSIVYNMALAECNPIVCYRTLQRQENAHRFGWSWLCIQGDPKSKPLSNDQKIVL